MRKIGISILVLFLALGMNIASPFQKNVIQAAENTGFEIHTISVGNADATLIRLFYGSRRKREQLQKSVKQLPYGKQ